ncbi:MAG TPA: prepilin-type N-terminal cleavage/methylation domain-containing protein [Longimicrobiales bacterium]|nr:prepilin-type N-terminal cleavage/methylation domain-containing protein [Longimicrobiales bacterium]
MRRPSSHPESGFTLVELTIVVVISTIALIAIYQTLLTQERSYRYQTAAIDTQGSTRVALQLMASELRELSASAGAEPALTGGSDLLVAMRDSIRFRAFRKIGIVCTVHDASDELDVWVPGTAFAVGDVLALFQERDPNTDDDDTWATGLVLSGVGTATNADQCRNEWSDYPLQKLAGLPGDTLALMERGALVRSYVTLTYGAYQWDGEWVLGRRETDGSIVPLVGPLLPPRNGGIVFRYFGLNNQELTPSTEAERALVSRVEVTVRAMSRGGPDHTSYVDSLGTNVYLRGN